MKTIYYKFSILVVTIVSTIMLAFGRVNYYVDKERRYQHLREDILLVEQRLKETLPDALWTLNKPLIEKLFGAEAKSSWIVGFELYDEDGQSVFSSRSNIDNITVDETRKIPLYIEGVDRKFQIGELRILISEASIKQELLSEQRRLTAMIIVLNCFLIIAILIGIRKYIIKPINAIQNAIEMVSKSDADLSFRLHEDTTLEFSGINREFNIFLEKLERVMGGDIDDVHRIIQRIANGELNSSIIPKLNLTHDSVMGSLAQMQKNILQINSDLKVALDSAETATRAKSEFLASMSHEIRTPLNVVIGMSHLAIYADSVYEQREYLKNIQDAGRYLLNIVNDVLDFSKIEAGKIQIESVIFEIDTVLSNIATLFKRKAEEKDIELLFDVGPGVPTTLIGDPLRIGQILVNYVGNALKFTDSGDIQVKVELVGVDGTDLLIRFSVKDSGRGIPAEHLNKLFNSFEQGPNSTSREFGGTGLGLAISKRLAHLMHGEVGAESEIGCGSKFWVTLRCSGAQVSSPFALLRSQVQYIRVLVIDDNLKVGDSIKNFMSELQFTVNVYSSWSDGVVELNRGLDSGFPYSLLLINQKMQDFDGLDIIKVIRKEPSLGSLKIILLSSGSNKNLLDNSTINSVDGILLKPLQRSDLIDVVLRVLGFDVERNKLFRSTDMDQYHSVPPVIGGRSILVVEDNLLNQKVARGLIVETGANVDIAPTGFLCLEMLQRKNYDLVFMDIQMPDMDGIETSRLIRRDNSFDHIPIIAMTANAQQEDRVKCADAGMNDFIPKPIDPLELWNVLSRFLKPVRDSETLPGQLSQSVDIDLSQNNAPDVADLIGLFSSLNIEAGLARALGNRERYKSYLVEFFKSQTDTPRLLSEAFKRKEWNKVSLIAHTLRGVAGHIGAERLQGLSLNVELLANNRYCDEKDFQELIYELSQLLNEIAVNVQIQKEEIDVAKQYSKIRVIRLTKALRGLLALDDIRVLEFSVRRSRDIYLYYGDDASHLMQAISDVDFDKAFNILNNIQ